jgi:hypothetical protein
MNTNDNIKSIDFFGNVTYVLDDDSLLFPTGYKVLQSQGRGDLLRCTKYKSNGKLKLLYFADGMKPLSDIVSGISNAGLLLVISNIISAVLNVKSNGFLQYQNIDTAINRIFIDNSTLAAHLIYIPISTLSLVKEYEFENELKATLLKAISLSGVKTPAAIQIQAHIQDASMDLKKISSYVKSEGNLSASSAQTEILQQHGASQKVGARLVSENAPVDTIFAIDKPEFVIGKSKGSVDGVIGYSKAISRVHCKVFENAGKYYAMDLGSLNGSFLNGTKLAPNVPIQLKNDDKLRLADCEFRITI